MKQGRASRDVNEGGKVEPKSRAVNTTFVADIGVKHVKTVATPMYDGRGYKAPMHSQSTKKGGSQGRY